MSFMQRPPVFLVWNPKTGHAKYRHKTIESAEAEAQRLANLHPFEKFHVLVSLGRCTADRKIKRAAVKALRAEKITQKD